MTPLEEFQTKVKAGEIFEALAIAMSEAIELEITTSITLTTDRQSESAWDRSAQMQTRINLIEGKIENEIIRIVITGIAIFGWAYLFIASFAINHFELFGLQQVYCYFNNQEVPNIPFKEQLMYKFDRHPIMTGALLGMWFTPQMTADHLIFSTLFTLLTLFFSDFTLQLFDLSPLFSL